MTRNIKEVILKSEPKATPLAGFNLVSHTLNNGARIITLSNHSFKYSDGTESKAQDVNLVNKLTLTKQQQKINTVLSMNINEIKMLMSKEQEALLHTLQEMCDIVIAPFPMLIALRESGNRHLFPKVVAFNATSDTQRLPPTSKVVDINNWSW